MGSLSAEYADHHKREERRKFNHRNEAKKTYTDTRRDGERGERHHNYYITKSIHSFQGRAKVNTEWEEDDSSLSHRLFKLIMSNMQFSE